MSLLHLLTSAILLTSVALQLGLTALHHAVIDGRTDMASFLMASFNTNIDAKDAVSTVCNLHIPSKYPYICNRVPGQTAAVTTRLEISYDDYALII